MRIESMGNAQRISASEQTAQRPEAVDQAAEIQAAEIQATEIQVAEAQAEVEQPTQMEQQAKISEEMLKKSIEQANKSLAVYDRKIERAVHEVTKTVMYTIKDIKTDEVIREFPPKKIQDMIAKMWELAGLFVDEKA